MWAKPHTAMWLSRFSKSDSGWGEKIPIHSHIAGSAGDKCNWAYCPLNMGGTYKHNMLQKVNLSFLKQFSFYYLVNTLLYIFFKSPGRSALKIWLPELEWTFISHVWVCYYCTNQSVFCFLTCHNRMQRFFMVTSGPIHFALDHTKYSTTLRCLPHKCCTMKFQAIQNALKKNDTTICMFCLAEVERRADDISISDSANQKKLCIQ